MSTELQCLSCGATSTNGLVLCDLCQHKIRTDLTYLPIYFRNLSRWRPGRAGVRQVPGSRALYDGPRSTGVGDRIERALDEAMNTTTTWARTLTDDRGPFAQPLTLANAILADQWAASEDADTFAWLCAGLDHHLVSIATLEWCAEFGRDIAAIERRLGALTEDAVPGWYAGRCKRRISMESACGAATYVIPGLTWVRCRACGSTTYARDRIDVILVEARDWVATPKRLAEAIVALVDSEQSVERLRKRITTWGNRDQIDVIRRDAYALRRYRLGDVLDRLAADGPTRLRGNDEDVTA